MADFLRLAAYRSGLRAEWIAAWYLRLRGYRILKSRYKTPAGEIDLIARKGACLVFVEVKFRPGQDQALEAVSQHSRRRIERAALLFLAEQNMPMAAEMRFDVIAVTSLFSIRHLDNAWQART